MYLSKKVFRFTGDLQFIREDGKDTVWYLYKYIIVSQYHLLSRVHTIVIKHNLYIYDYSNLCETAEGLKDKVKQFNKNSLVVDTDNYSSIEYMTGHNYRSLNLGI